MKKFFSLVLALVMALSLTTVAWGAEVTTISTPEDLIAFAESVNVEHLTYTGKTVTLANDIDMTGKTLTAIGSLLNGYCFGGTFDGNGKTISNLTVTSLDACGTGLFGSVDEHHGHMDIKDLTIDGATITATAGGPVGAILGMGYAATIENCQVKNSVVKSGGAYDQYSGAAAVVGNGLGGSVVEDCSATNCVVDTTANGNPAGDIAGPWSPAGAVVGSTSSGNKIVADLGTPDATYSGLYLKGTGKGDVITSYTATLGYTKAVAPTYDEDTGLVNNQPAIAYYVTDSAAFGDVYVQVPTLAEADVVVYNDADAKVVFVYLAVADNIEYEGNGVAFTNFGKACGQYKDANYDKTAKYYSFQNVVYKAVETSATALMVNGKLVPVEPATGAFVPHIASYTYNDKFEVTAVKCGVCGCAATIVPNYASLPDAVKALSINNVINGGQYFYWGVASAPAADEKVESAETFDAGIAMYVGMSVMAAAGSAVVLKKRED